MVRSGVGVYRLAGREMPIPRAPGPLATEAAVLGAVTGQRVAEGQDPSSEGVLFAGLSTIRGVALRQARGCGLLGAKRSCPHDHGYRGGNGLTGSPAPPVRESTGANMMSDIGGGVE